MTYLVFVIDTYKYTRKQNTVTVVHVGMVKKKSTWKVILQLKGCLDVLSVNLECLDIAGTRGQQALAVT